ncbi:MAG: Ig-like domain-containing protein [Nitrospirae bacterium]|nr:Ig-like domain-containing protein [Nitrospirota bacterium]
MRRILIFIAFFVSIISLISCNSGSSSSSAPGGVNPGMPSDVQLLPLQYIVQTNSDAFFKARVLDGNGRPVPGVAVTFTNISPIGTITASKAVKTGSVSKSGTTVANTNSLGYATARVWSPNAGFVTVQAEVDAGTGQVRDKKTIYFSTFDFSIPVPVEPIPDLHLQVDGEDLNETFDDHDDFYLFQTPDDDEVIVRATVLDGDGNPASFVNVTFGADSLEASFPEGSTKTTDSNGQAQVRVKVAQALRDLYSTLNITASALVDGKSASDMITLFLLPSGIDVGSISLNATPAQVEPGGTSVIDAYVTTSAGGAVPDGTTVNFIASCGFVVPFAQTTDGKATVDFTAPLTVGTCIITGSVAGISDTVDVVVTSATGIKIIPASQTISNPAVSNTATYTILGGTGPYTAFSSIPGLVTVPAGSFAGPEFIATVAGVPVVDTTVTITVYDSLGASAIATLILDVPSDPLKVTPTAQTKVPPFTTATYTVTGGIGPYSAFSSSPGLVTVPATFAGPTLTATIIAAPSVDTTVTITIYDSAGSSVTATLVLDVAGVTPLAVAPSAVTVTGFANPEANPADDVTFTITGGTGPFSMFSNNNAIIASQGPLGGSTFVVDPDAVAVSNAVLITVQDSIGAFATATVTVTPPVSSFTLLPSAISVLEGDSVTVYLYGGIGPYETFTTDASGLCAPAPDDLVPPTPPQLEDTVTSFVVGPIPLGCAGQTHTITLVDNIGKQATFKITINPDVIAPTVIATFPANTAIGVPIDTPVSITWSEPIDCSTVNTTNITIAPFLPPTWTLFSCTGSNAIFTPVGQLASTVYTVTISTAVTDIAGNPMVSPYIFSYSTP